MCHFNYLGNGFYNKLRMFLPDKPAICVLIFVVYTPGGKRRRVNTGPLDGQSLFSWTVIFALTIPISPE